MDRRSMPSPERARRFLYGFYMDMDPEKTLDPGMRAIFFPVQSYQIRRQNRQRFRGVRLLTPNSFLNDRTAQTESDKKKKDFALWQTHRVWPQRAQSPLFV